MFHFQTLFVTFQTNFGQKFQTFCRNIAKLNLHQQNRNICENDDFTQLALVLWTWCWAILSSYKLSFSWWAPSPSAAFLDIFCVDKFSGRKGHHLPEVEFMQKSCGVTVYMIDRAKLKNIIIFSDSNLWRCLKIVQLELQNLEWTLPLTGGSPVRLKLLQPLHFTWEAFTCPSFFTLSGKYEGSPITILVLAVSPCEVTPQTWPISSYLISSMGLSSM